jgi:hypothetical protein
VELTKEVFSFHDMPFVTGNKQSSNVQEYHVPSPVPYLVLDLKLLNGGMKQPEALKQSTNDTFFPRFAKDRSLDSL